jgi:hypothetical protein
VIPAKRHYLSVYAEHSLSDKREHLEDDEYVSGAEYNELYKEFIDHMWWERTAKTLQDQRDATISVLIAAEAQVYLRTQEYPFNNQEERADCWSVLGEIHTALIAAGITVHNPVGLDGKPA